MNLEINFKWNVEEINILFSWETEIAQSNLGEFFDTELFSNF